MRPVIRKVIYAISRLPLNQDKEKCDQDKRNVWPKSMPDYRPAGLLKHISHFQCTVLLFSELHQNTLPPIYYKFFKTWQRLSK